ncbi:MAG: ATP synthase F1 subunit delta [Gammaproteobacteria bacterium]
MNAAAPYAAAAFSYARGAGEDVARKWMRLFNALAESEDAVFRAARAMRGGQEPLAETLAAATEADDAFRNFLRIVAAAGRMEVLGAIARRYAELHAAAGGVLDIRVETARPMDLAARSEFDRALAKWSGKKVRALYSENSELLGGVRVHIKDNVLDASIRGRIDRLAAAIH